MKEATFSAYITRSILQFAARYGVSLEEVCITVGLDSALLQMPDQQIPGSLHHAIWREVIKQTGDENFGLHLGEAFNLATFGIVGYVLLNCQTLGEALEKLSRYTRLFSQGAQIHISVSEGIAFCDCIVVENLKNYLLEEPRYAIDSTFASLLTATQELTGKSLRLYSVWFQYPQPASRLEYDRIFQTEQRFSMPMNRLIFDANSLKWSILSKNANLLTLFEQHAETMLEQMNRANGYTQQVVQVMMQQLKGELPTIDAVAQQLAMSVRQLQRELQTEETSFQQLLDETRRELALRYLKNLSTPIHDIAFLLGFSEPSAFHRAFKRWTGKTPRSYRLSTKAPFQTNAPPKSSDV
jgi:AraC-like DNA-binding protein